MNHKILKCLYTFLFVLATSLTVSVYAQYPSGSPVAINGKLKLVGNKLSNECGNPVQLRGMSSHGVQWFGNCYTTSALDALANTWKVDLFRVAMYVQEGGYVNNPTYWKGWIDNMVDECGRRGIYCLIDWHVLNPGDPNANIVQARDFWSYMSAKHAGKKHVIYEICNEPNGVDWTRVKTYADDIILRIRANDPSTIIIVGTPTWSQDVDIAANNKLNYSNIMYALHFYSGTHTDWLRSKANTALSKGLALFVTEFGTSLASGDGGPYLAEGQKWMDWMAANNISWANWSFADKAEISAALNPGSCGGNWNSTTTSGTWIKQKLTSPADNFNCSSGGTTTPVNQAPKTSISSPTSGATFTAPASIQISATASDADGTIAKVEFYNGSVKIGEDVSSPYSYGWANVAAGTYNISVKAIDNSGATGTSSSVSVSVSGTSGGVTNAAPLVQITSPSSGSSFTSRANVTINANASDADGTVAKVEFFNGSTKLGEDFSSPYSLSLRKAANGAYAVTAKATDNKGLSSTSSIVSFTVGSTSTGNALPTLSISSPANGAAFTAPASITITANAADADGSVTKVEFFNGSTKLGEDLSSPYAYTWTGVIAGTYSLTARATDNSTAVATSGAISVTVGSGGTTSSLCQVTSTIPAAGEWVLRNPWGDQNNGSGVSNNTDALKISHRQYGMDHIWLVQTGKQVNLQAGKIYTVKFDISNDAMNPVNGIEAGFASVTNWDGPVLVQPSVSFATGFPSSFTTKSINFTASVNATANLALKLKWLTQPNQLFTGLIKNLSVCAATSSLRIEDSNVEILDNPFEASTTVRILGEEPAPLRLSIIDFAGRIVHESSVHKLNEYITIGEKLQSGIYFVKAEDGNNSVVFRIVKK